MDLLKELSQKTRVFDHQIEANTLQPTLNGMGQGKDYTNLVSCYGLELLAQ